MDKKLNKCRTDSPKPSVVMRKYTPCKRRVSEPSRYATSPAKRIPPSIASKNGNPARIVSSADVYAPMDIKPALPKEKSRVNPVSTETPKTAIKWMHRVIITPCI